jgi:class 3 adenylate cyclase
VDSTGIAAKLDAEEWRDLVGAYIDAASAAVVEMGGKVAKKLGDGLMALFGYPVAQENDAERAVRGRATPPRDRSTVERVESLAPKPAVRVGCRSSRRDFEACADRGHGRARRQVGARLARISSCLGGRKQ